MKVVPFEYYRSATKDNDTTELFKVYGIQDNEGRWFAWCYRNESIASIVMDNLSAKQRDATDIAVNWKTERRRCVLSDKQ